MADQWLYKFDGGGPFAFSADGEHYYLAPGAGGGYWAWRDRDWFYAASGGRPLGWLRDTTFYEQGTGKALYFLST